MIDEDSEFVTTSLIEVLDLLKKKNDSYGDSWRELGVLGLVYRIKDKCNRLINIIVNDKGSIEDIDEEVMDIAGYALLLLKIRDEKGKIW